mmetsp:Transcript_59128/g.129714  ORF Transcript_59128/g.129714 Transcript_59128/m.129714 type:complete len:220 (-) Transcript_59128:1533-2192(-)
MDENDLGIGPTWYRALEPKGCPRSQKRKMDKNGLCRCRKTQPLSEPPLSGHSFLVFIAVHLVHLVHFHRHAGCPGCPAADSLLSQATAPLLLSRVDVVSEAQARAEPSGVGQKNCTGKRSTEGKRRDRVHGEQRRSQETRHAPTQRFTIAAVDLEGHENLRVTHGVEQVHVRRPFGAVNKGSAHKDLRCNGHWQAGAHHPKVEKDPGGQNESEVVGLSC